MVIVLVLRYCLTISYRCANSTQKKVNFCRERNKVTIYHRKRSILPEQTKEKENKARKLT